MTNVEFVDRYSATRTAYPNPWTSCKGGCEGMGLYPMRFEKWSQLDNAPGICPQRNENDEWESFPPVDGSVFVWCKECSGSGRRVNGKLGYYLDFLYTYYYQLYWPVWAIRYMWEKPTIRQVMSEAPYYLRFIHREQVNQRRLLRSE